MIKTKTFENYPLGIVILSNLLSILIYLLGAFILAKLGIIFLVVYLLYCLFMELNVLKRSCVNCYYYGKLCGFGKGKLCSLFFKKGDIKKFSQREITFKDLLPDFCQDLQQWQSSTLFSITSITGILTI